MKTPQQWQEAYTTMLSDEDRSGMQQWIGAIQSDARQGMVSKEALRPTIELIRQHVNYWGVDWIGLQQSFAKELRRLESLLGESKGEVK